MVISCYIPLYNNATVIISVLESIISQSLSFDRIIVVDDFSSDNSYSLVNDFFQKQKSNHSSLSFELIKNVSNIGLSRIRNKFLDLSHHDKYSIMIDSDVVLEKDWLKNMVAFMKSHSCIAASGFLEEKFKKSLANKWKFYFMKQHFSHSSGDIGHIFGSNMIIDRQLISPYFRFPDIYLNNAEDIYFSKKMKQFGLLGYNHSAKAEHLKSFNSLFDVFRNYYSWTRYEKKNLSFLGSVYQNLLIINHLYHKKGSLYMKFLHIWLFPLFCIWDLLGRK